jgi:hypothetical protein
MQWVAQVAHLTPWNVDKPLHPGCGCAEVRLGQAPVAGAAVTGLGAPGMNAAAGTTGADGVVCAKVLPTGVLTMHATAEGLYPVGEPAQLQVLFGDPKCEGPNTAWPRVVIPLVASECVSGVVVDGGGNSVASAQVVAVSQMPLGGMPAPTVTIADGGFTVLGMPAAKAKVVTSATVDGKVMVAVVDTEFPTTAAGGGGTQCAALPPVKLAIAPGQADYVAGCGVPVVTVVEGTEVAPVTTLHAMAIGSLGADGQAVEAWQWTVVAPEGVVAPFLSSAKVANQTLQVNAAGSYQLCLLVDVGQKNPACKPGCATVQVVPAGPVHVEVVWDTPGDPNPSDKGPIAGADLDLHVGRKQPALAGLKPDADCDGKPDPWYDLASDLFWLGKVMNWSQGGAAQDSLLIDGNTSAEPEIAVLPSLADPNSAIQQATVAVHGWKTNGFGPSNPDYSRLLLLQARLARASRLSSSLLAAAHR